jgi:hypothetical protein
MIPYEASTIESGYYIGTVMDTDPITREIDVYIPKLMPIIDSADNVSYKTKTHNLNITLTGSSAIDGNVVMRKSITARAEDKDETLPLKDSKVIVYFIENNPNLAFWRKFNVNGIEYEKDNSDRLEKEKLFSMEFIRSSTNTVLNSIDIHKDDKITVDIPNNMSITIDKTNPENIKITIN